MNRCHLAVLAERATIHDDGRVDIVGGHLRELRVPQLPGRIQTWLVIIVEFAWSETAGEHRLAVDVVDRHGAPRGYRMSRPLRIPPRSSGQPPMSVPVLVPVSVIVTDDDHLVVRARLDGDVIAELPLRVVVASAPIDLDPVPHEQPTAFTR